MRLLTKVKEANGTRLLGEGLAAFDRRQFERAAKLYERALEEGLPTESLAVAHTCLGNALSELGRLDEARAEHERALEIDPSLDKAWVNLGVVHRLQGDLDEAERCYREALKLAPDYAELHASLGALHVFRDEPEQAVESLRRAIALDARLPIAHANLAIALAMAGRFEEVEASLKHAVVLGYPNAAAARQRIDGLRDAAPPVQDVPVVDPPTETAPETSPSLAHTEEQIIEIARRTVPVATELTHFFVCSSNPSLIEAFHGLLRVGAPAYGGSAGHYRADAGALGARQAEAAGAELAFAGRRLLATTVSDEATVAGVLARLKTECTQRGISIAYVSMGPRGLAWVREIYDTLLGQAVQQGILPFAMYSTDDADAARFLLDSFVPVSTS